jgi:Mn-dependent DtxR family transcriptional regulator
MYRNNDLETAILNFLFEWVRPIRVGELRRQLAERDIEVPHSTLNSVIKRMEEEGLLSWKKYGPVSLTDKGYKSASHTKRHFHLISMFLVKTLDISLQKAKEESYSICGILSCELIENINQKLNEPETCICKKQIPVVNDCGHN